MLKKVLFVAAVSAFVVACGSSNTASSTPSADSTTATAPVVDTVKQDTAVKTPAATPAEKK